MERGLLLKAPRIASYGQKWAAVPLGAYSFFTLISFKEINKFLGYRFFGIKMLRLGDFCMEIVRMLAFSELRERFNGWPHVSLCKLPVHAFRGNLLHFIGGPALFDDAALAQFRHHKFGAPADHPATDAEACAELDGEYCYGGIFYPFHFGHFLTECAHRILPSKILFDCERFLFVYGQHVPFSASQIPAWLGDMLRFLDVHPEQITILSEDARVEQLHVAPQGTHLYGSPLPGYLEMLAEFNDRRFTGWDLSHLPKKIYISRSHIPHGGNFLGEAYIEQLLTDAGFTIIHPQEHGFEAQLQFYLAADDIIFCEGSACHGCEFFGPERMNRVFLIGKREVGNYRRVLAPRSREFHVQSGNHYIGHPLFHDAQFISSTGVHMYDLGSLLGFLNLHSLLLQQNFSISAYAACVISDFDVYLDYYIKKQGKIADAQHCDNLRQIVQAHLAATSIQAIGV